MRALSWTGAVVAACVGCGTTTGGRADPGVAPGEPLSRIVPAAAFSGVEVDGRDGELVVVGSLRSDIEVHVTLGPGCRAHGGHAVRLEERGSTLRLAVLPSTEDRCDERWAVRIPDRIRVSGSMDRADIRIGGVRAGVEMRLGNGTLDVTVAGGDLDLRVEKGDIIAHTDTESVGAVSLESQVGEVRLTIDGGTFTHRRPPGPGDKASFDGRGRDHLTLRTIVGHVRATVR